MSLDEIKEKAVERVQADNPASTGFKAGRIYEQMMDGTLVTVTFQSAPGKEDSNHVHFGKDEVRVYRWHSDVLAAVANYKERNWFFRFLELVGIGGLIAFILVLVFSVLLCILSFSSTANTSILEIVKWSFSIILGYFFGQTAAKSRT
jgi:hypothetical protein